MYAYPDAQALNEIVLVGVRGRGALVDNLSFPKMLLT